MTADDLLSDPFHSVALWAYMEIAAETGHWPPDSKLTKRRAYDLFERQKREVDAPV